MNNVEVLITKRPKTQNEQLREVVSRTNKEFILLTDDDAIFTEETKRLISSSDGLYLNPKYDILRFRWLNERNKEATGIFFIRVSALRKINLKCIPSIGADAVLQELLSTKLSDTFAFIHPLKQKFKIYFRWGKGRAYCYRITRKKNVTRTVVSNVKTRITWKHLVEIDISGRLIWAYCGYIAGYAWGLIIPIKDEHW